MADNPLVSVLQIGSSPYDIKDATSRSAIVTLNNIKADKTQLIPYGEVDSTSTSTSYTATVPGITELKDGTCMLLRNGVVTSAAGFTININGLGAKPSYNNMATGNPVTPTNPTQDTTIFNINYTMLFIYNEDLVSGGCWICYRGYDANTNTLGYQLRSNSYSKAMTDITYRYRLLFSSADNSKWVPANTSSSTNATSSRAVCQTPINPFGEIVYYSTTASVAAGSRPSATNLWQQYTLTLGYSFNRTGAALTLTSWKPVYVKCAPQADGSAIMDADTPYVQDLPTTDDGKIYIFLGVAYSTTAIELLMNHPVFYYKDGAIRQWSNAYIPSAVQSNWNETDTSSAAYIQNKPSITQDQDGYMVINPKDLAISADGAFGAIDIDGGLSLTLTALGNSIDFSSGTGDDELLIHGAEGVFIEGDTNKNIKLTTNGSGKAYYNNKEIATKDDIPAAGTLNTTNTTAQTTSASESLSGTINLHKVSKTGSYNDLNDKPTIPSISGLAVDSEVVHKGEIGNIAEQITADKQFTQNVEIDGSLFVEGGASSIVLGNDASDDTLQDALNDKALAPLVIEVDDTDTTVPSGTYDSITAALTAGKEVWLKVTLTQSLNYKLYMQLSQDQNTPNHMYWFSAIYSSASYTAVIDYASGFIFTKTSLAPRESPTFTGTPKAPTAAAGTNTTQIATTAFVTSAINSLPDPMVFKGSLGTGGTITTLPTASNDNKGFTYKVITAGTYASQAAKVGDTFISDGSTWVLIPSGDEPSGTVTSITLNATAPLTINDSSAITTSGTRTLGITMDSSPTNNSTNAVTSGGVYTEINKKADKTLVVTITRSGTSPNYTYTASETASDIADAIDAGTNVIVEYGVYYYTLSFYNSTSNRTYFTRVVEGSNKIEEFEIGSSVSYSESGIADKVLRVTITRSGTSPNYTYSADKTYSEILSALGTSSGNTTVILLYNTVGYWYYKQSTVSGTSYPNLHFKHTRSDGTNIINSEFVIPPIGNISFSETTLTPVTDISGKQDILEISDWSTLDPEVSGVYINNGVLYTVIGGSATDDDNCEYCNAVAYDGDGAWPCRIYPDGDVNENNVVYHNEAITFTDSISSSDIDDIVMNNGVYRVDADGILYVKRNLVSNKTTQALVNSTGIKIRTKTGNGNWTEWGDILNADNIYYSDNTYSNEHYVAVGDSLNDAITELDNAVYANFGSRVLLHMTLSNDTPSFTDADSNALTHAEVKTLLENSSKDVVIEKGDDYYILEYYDAESFDWYYHCFVGDNGAGLFKCFELYYNNNAFEYSDYSSNYQTTLSSTNKLNADYLFDGTTNKPSVWNNKADTPLVIEVDDTDTTVPSGTYASITAALAAGRDVIVKVTYTEDAGQVFICRINIDDSTENDYVFTTNIAAEYYWCDIDSQNNFTFYNRTLAGDLSSTFASSHHTHGYIKSDGTITTFSTIFSGDRLLIRDTSNKIVSTQISFDGSTTSKVLSKKGTWVDIPSTGANITYTGDEPYLLANGDTVDESLDLLDGAIENLYDNSLPSVSSSDNGKVLKVVSGAWAAGTESSGSEMVDVTITGTTSSASFSANPYNAIKTVVDDGKIAVLNASVTPLSTTDVLIPVYEYTYSQSGSDYTGYKGKIQNGNYEISVDVQSTSSATVTITSVGSSITVDTALSESSTNPVQNRVITATILENEEITAAALNNLNDRIEYKQDQLVSGTTIKTINNQSILGSGNITISGGGGGSGEENVIEVVKVNGTALTPDANKAVDVQAITGVTVGSTALTPSNGVVTIVSGTDIKTINSTSLLGSGDISVGTYSKPSGGIPSTDMASAVTTSLGKADTAVQDIQAKVGTGTAASIVNSSTKVATIQMDTTPTSGSTNVVTSGGIYTAVNAKYTKPSGGIPSTDLASAVQTSLGLADTALQSYTETDPVFTASAAHGISSTDISNWNAKGTYSKPSGGIPASDLAGSIGASKLDTAAQQRLLPEGTSSDDGKIMRYSYTGGGWQMVKPITVYTGTSAPSSSTGSDGDIYIQTTS